MTFRRGRGGISTRNGFPPIIASRYRVLGLLGRGNMGQVLRVEHIHTHEQLALKVLFVRHEPDGELEERFNREARAWTLLGNDHVVRVIDAGTAPELEGAPYIVMELLVGADLDWLLARQGKLGPSPVVAIFGQVAKALHRAHAAGMVHRDLKPANIFLHRGEGGLVVKVLDFGLLKLAPPEELAAPQQTTVTAPGALLGTPVFMAPEQVRGPNDSVGPPADIWALGMLAFRLLSGEHYWVRPAMSDMLHDILNLYLQRPTVRAPALGEAFDAWFFRSCDRDTTARWTSITEQWEALGDALLPAGAARELELGELIELPEAAGPNEGPGFSASGTTAVVGGSTSPLNTKHAPSDSISVVHPPISVVTSGDGERRQVTVMFFSPVVRAATGEIDPEDLARVVSDFNGGCADVLGGPDTSVSHFEGAGKYVYFGYPHAHGNDAARAVAAGLRVLDAAARLDARLRAESGVSLGVRVGIHSGLVVASEITAPKRQPREIVGAAPAVAAELQRFAPPNTVVVSAATRRLIEQSFAWRSLGKRDLATAPGMEIFEVVGAPTGPRAATPFVGRDAELRILLDRWERVATEGGQIALLVGEAGIGKSRCLAAFRDALAGQRFRWLACHCSPYFVNRALHPIIELVNGMIGDGQRADRSAGLRDLLHGLALPPDAPALLAALLSIPPDEGWAPLNVTPQRQRQLTQEALLALLQALGEREPLCLVLEDLHWVDPSTLELLDLLVDRAAGTRIMALLTSRPEFRPEWGARVHVTQQNLARLPKTRAAEMIRELTRGRDLPAELIDQLVARADGVPLFVEELTRMVLDAKDDGDVTTGSISGPLPQNIPSSLRESLTARLDRLGVAKSTAQLAAVIGHDFDYEALAAISKLGEAVLLADLARLVESDLVVQHGAPPRATYAFKHDLVQEAAYESLLKNARRQIHQDVAEALAARGGAEPEVLAHHYAAAGLAFQAVGQLMSAAQGALQRSANVEARNLLERAISLLEGLTDSAARTQMELRARALLGVPLFSTRGYGAPEVEQTYARAAELAKRVHTSDAPELFPVLWGLWIFHLVRARHRTALEFAGRLVRLADHTPDPGLRLAALVARGNTECLHGSVAAARADLELGIALYRPDAHRHYAYICGQDLSVQARAMQSWSLWLLGYPDQALRRATEAVTIAEGLSHPASLGFALAMKMVVHQFRREPEETEKTSSALRELAQAQGLVHWLGPAIMSHGWAVQAAGRLAEGLAEMRRGREMFEQVGALVAMGFYDARLIEVCGKAGEADECRRRLDLVRPMVEAEERVFAPEIHRVEGELRLSLSGDPVGAEALFHRALDAAAAVGARSFELRTALSLARLWQSLGRRDAARDLVERFYATFTEGFETGDLREARAFLGR